MSSNAQMEAGGVAPPARSNTKAKVVAVVSVLAIAGIVAASTIDTTSETVAQASVEESQLRTSEEGDYGSIPDPEECNFGPFGCAGFEGMKTKKAECSSLSGCKWKNNKCQTKSNCKCYDIPEEGCIEVGDKKDCKMYHGCKWTSATGTCELLSECSPEIFDNVPLDGNLTDGELNSTLITRLLDESNGTGTDLLDEDFYNGTLTSNETELLDEELEFINGTLNSNETIGEPDLLDEYSDELYTNGTEFFYGGRMLEENSTEFNDFLNGTDLLDFDNSTELLDNGTTADPLEFYYEEDMNSTDFYF
mmetsp:Transcript_14500/g.25994  ORF Transcript_14500/g.25994 Transcript_14500/m.25994 type:complete len:306 (-) Transcript_14500:411-1328(-)